MKIKFSTPPVLSLLRSTFFRHFRILRVYPLSARCRHFPRRRKQFLFYCLCERSEAISREGGGLRSIFSVLFQGDCRGTSCLAMTTSRAMVRWDISLALNMTYFSLYVILNAVKNPTEELTGHLLFTLVVGYFANAQYDVREL